MNTRILLTAEDTPERQVITKMLQRLGCQVECVDNGFLAIDALRHGDYDLVLLDRDLNELVDILETTHLVRQYFDKKTLPVIGMFPGARSPELMDCSLAGMNDHIIKPVAMYKFQDILQRFRPVDRAPATVTPLPQAVNS